MNTMEIELCFHNSGYLWQFFYQIYQIIFYIDHKWFRLDQITTIKKNNDHPLDFWVLLTGFFYFWFDYFWLIVAQNHSHVSSLVLRVSSAKYSLTKAFVYSANTVIMLCFVRWKNWRSLRAKYDLLSVLTGVVALVG